MKKIFTYFFLLATSLGTCIAVSAQISGDYQSKGTFPSGATWSTISVWEFFDGTSWIPATSYPTSTAGTITIQNGDSIILNNAIAIDQVVINTGGILALFVTNPTPSVTITLADAAGDDIIVNGRLVLALGLTLEGSGTIKVNSGGRVTLKHNAILKVPINNDGNMFLEAQNASYIGTIDNTNVINNGTFIWISPGGLALANGGTFLNNGTFTVTSTQATVTMSNIGTGNLFTNNGTLLNNRTGTLNVSTNVTNATTGTIGGSGTINFTVAPTNSGTISPGMSPGILAISPSAVSTSTVNIELISSTVPGTGHDRLDVSGNLDLSSVSLNIIDNPAAPIATYTIMTNTTGSFTGSFAPGSTIPANFSSPVITPTSVTITKLTVLPVVWGNDFVAQASGSNVRLTWSTSQESNNSYFTIEHSIDGNVFNNVGQLNAVGNTNTTSYYSFIHTTPTEYKTNIYRIKQTDLDGKTSYSVLRSLKLSDRGVKPLTFSPNPVQNKIVLTVYEKDVTVTLHNINGIEVKRWKLDAGTFPIDLQSIPAGIYQMNIYNKSGKIDTQKLMKL